MTTSTKTSDQETGIRKDRITDIAFMGLRAAIGTIFIVNGTGKFNPGFSNYVTNTLGFPAEMQIPLALAELVPGILIILGILTRMSSSLLSIVSLGAIFYVKEASNLTGDGGYEIDLILLASNLLLIAAGPGRISVQKLISAKKTLPGFMR